MQANHHSFLFRLSYRVMKFFLLTLFGFASACALSFVLGISFIGISLISAFGHLLFRFGLLALLMMAVAILFESIKY